MHAAPGNPGIAAVATLHDVDPMDGAAVAASPRRARRRPGRRRPRGAAGRRGRRRRARPRASPCFGPSAGRRPARGLQGVRQGGDGRRRGADRRRRASARRPTRSPPRSTRSARRTSSRTTGSPPARASWSPTTATRRWRTPPACERVVVEEFLDGPEVSLFARLRRRRRRGAAAARPGLQAHRRRRHRAQHRRHGRLRPAGLGAGRARRGGAAHRACRRRAPSLDDARRRLRPRSTPSAPPYVVKDDGLAAGKGVVVTDDRDGGAGARGRVRAGRDRGVPRRPRGLAVRDHRRRRRSTRCCRPRTSSGSSTATRARTPAAWAPTPRCRGRRPAWSTRCSSDRAPADRRRDGPPRHAVRRPAVRRPRADLARRRGSSSSTPGSATRRPSRCSRCSTRRSAALLHAAADGHAGRRPPRAGKPAPPSTVVMASAGYPEPPRTAT